MKDYNNTIIYCLKHKDDFTNQNVCIGSTTNFTKRKYKYKNDCCNLNSKSYNEKKHKFIRENGGWENWVIYQIEQFPCKGKREAEMRERYWYDYYSAKLNSYRPYITQRERLDISRNHFNNKYKNNEEFREKKRIEELKRYHQNKHNPQYMEKRRIKSLEYYYKNKDKDKIDKSSTT